MPYADPAKARERNQLYYAQNRERLRAWQNEYYSKPENKLKRKLYNLKRKDHLAKYTRQWRAAHPERVRQWSIGRHKDPKRKAYNKQYMRTYLPIYRRLKRILEDVPPLVLEDAIGTPIMSKVITDQPVEAPQLSIYQRRKIARKAKRERLKANALENKRIECQSRIEARQARIEAKRILSIEQLRHRAILRDDLGSGDRVASLMDEARAQLGIVQKPHIEFEPGAWAVVKARTG